MADVDAIRDGSEEAAALEEESISGNASSAPARTAGDILEFGYVVETLKDTLVSERKAMEEAYATSKDNWESQLRTMKAS